MLDIIDELISKTPEKGFLNNKIKFKCSTCGHLERSTYYTLLKEHQFEVLEPTSVSNTFIRESMYEEEITASPILFKKNCPKCTSVKSSVICRNVFFLNSPASYKIGQMVARCFMVDLTLAS